MVRVTEQFIPRGEYPGDGYFAEGKDLGLYLCQECMHIGVATKDSPSYGTQTKCIECANARGESR